MFNKIHDKTNVFWEVFRFLVVGVAATLGDFGTKTLVAYLLPEGSVPSWLHFGIPLVCGFVVGVLINYFLSVIWVFKNVDGKTNVKSQGNFWLFVGLGAIGLLLGLGIFYLARFIILSASGLDIDVGKSTINLQSAAFWAYFGVFCFQTLVVMVYNYLSRKIFIFKKPKEVAPLEPKEKEEK